MCCCCLVARSCPTLCDPLDCSLPGSSVHGILQARILDWVAVPSSRGSSQPRDQTWVSGIAGRLLTAEPPGKPCWCATIGRSGACEGGARGRRRDRDRASAEWEQSCRSPLCGQALEWPQWKAWGLKHDLMETSWSLRFPAEVTPQGSWIAGPPPRHHIFNWVFFIAWLNLASQSWSLGSDCGPLSVTTPQDLAWPWDPPAPRRVSLLCTWRGSMTIFTTCSLCLRFLLYKMRWYLKFFYFILEHS